MHVCVVHIRYACICVACIYNSWHVLPWFRLTWFVFLGLPLLVLALIMPRSCFHHALGFLCLAYSQHFANSTMETWWPLTRLLSSATKLTKKHSELYAFYTYERTMRTGVDICFASMNACMHGVVRATANNMRACVYIMSSCCISAENNVYARLC